jgi:hydroxymethylpyrimidine/phosphomethylpyrimidine kinase
MPMKGRPCALAIGGLDPGGGAGILADLRAFAEARVFGCAAVAVLTEQSTAGLRRVRALPARDVVAQVEEVLAHQRVRSLKVGALGSAANVRAVAKLLARHRAIPAVVDTPMRPTRGRDRLLALRAIATLREELLPQAALATVNLAEAEALLGVPVRTLGEARDAARALMQLGPRASLVKGGHLTGAVAVDVLAIGGAIVELRARRLALAPMHGTGCTFASLVAGRLARERATRSGRRAETTRGGADAASHPSGDIEILAAVRWAKRTHHRALAGAVDVGEGARVIAW